MNGGLILNVLNVALIFKVHYFQNEILELFLLFLQHELVQDNVLSYYRLQVKGYGLEFCELELLDCIEQLGVLVQVAPTRKLDEVVQDQVPLSV